MAVSLLREENGMLERPLPYGPARATSVL